MSTKAKTQSDAARSSAPSRVSLDFQNSSYWLVLAALFAAAIFLRHVVAANTDVSWLLTVGERMLDGQHLYADVIETNPPMAVLAYVPAIVIARILHVPPEIVVDALVFLGIAVSLFISAKILKASSVLDHTRCWPLLLIAFATLAILPTETFGQREHLALIALLPALAVYVLRANNETPSLWMVIVGGLGAGLTLTFKPHFGIAIFWGVTALALQARNQTGFWKVFIAPENLVAAAMASFYALCVAVVTPEFFTTIGPLVRDVYMQVGISWSAMLSKDAVPIWLALTVTAIALKRRNIDGPFLVLLAMSFGFAIAFLLQRKGFAYHSYPMIALAMLTLGAAIASNADDTKLGRIFNAGAAALLAVLFAVSMIWFNNAFDAKPLEVPVAKLGSNPRILAITAEPGIGHPLVRSLNGIWVSRQQALWVAAYAERIRRDAQGPLDSTRNDLLKTYEARERAMLVEDIRKNPPTAVLIDNLTGDWSAWLRDHQDVAELLKPYRHVETLNSVEILKRAN